MQRRHTALLVLLASLAFPARADWPTWQGDAGRSGRADAPAGIRGFKLVHRLAVHAEIRATPVLADGRLYVAAENGNLYAFDAAGAALQWLFHARGGIGSTPAVHDGAVYFLSRDGRVHALDAATGKPVWTFRTGGERAFAAHGMFGLPRSGEPVPDPWDLYLSSPLVHQGKVYVGSSDGHLYALEAKTGALAWAHRTGGVVHSSPALAGANVVVGSWDGAVYALDAASGEERWRFQTRTEQKTSVMTGIQASPAVDGDTVYVGARDGFFYALDAATGGQRWRYDAQGSWVVASAAQDRERVYVATSDTGLLLALDKRSGRELYRHPMQVWVFASPLLMGDMVVAASMKGELHAIDAAGGGPRWRWRTGEAAANASRIVDAAGKFDSERLFAGGAHALDAGLEHVKRLGAFVATPVWHGGRLIAATATGEVLFFAPER
ncbi:outer membrane protein assembly factor BamB family protein [Massilia agri]|uniref:PQQ-binding-like beta-propeller repeat protein n=1 Tax=Massilia agri TaxID=1886785 RepID=A0ABT2AHN7_9BURK|nr:PQQ-binding-like beta-propeller repeat protein [Massilia agri]MCS0595293.1 PQQ-binding-like beta-propeller repeat protein [Massilia agri]